MAGESEDTVTEPRSTEDILAETEELLSQTDATDSGSADDPLADSIGTDDDTSAEPAARERSGGSRLARLRSSLPSVGLPTPSMGLSSYFSPRAFVSLAALLGVGYVGGGLVIPIAGSLLGMALVAFLVGTVSSTRRYAEVSVAGGVVGALMAMISHLFLVVGGVASGVVYVGLTAGLLSVLLGYYFGRDLRAGLTGDPSSRGT